MWSFPCTSTSVCCWKALLYIAHIFALDTLDIYSPKHYLSRALCHNNLSSLSLSGRGLPVLLALCAACVKRTSWGRSGTSSSSASRPSRWATASARTTRTCLRTWSVGELRVAHRYASNPSSRWTLVEFPPPPAPGARRGDVGAEALRMRTHAHARRRAIRFLPFTPNRG